MREVDATLATFTTGLVARLCDGTTEPNSLPIVECCGTLLQVDIAGSSILAERIVAKSQQHAADAFAVMLNCCFATIISSIQSFGGEIVEFAGTAFWPSGNTRTG